MLLTIAGKQQIRCRGQDPRIGHIYKIQLPLLLTRSRIHSHHSPVPILRLPRIGLQAAIQAEATPRITTDKSLTLLVGVRALHKRRKRIVPGRNVKQPRLGAERRRIPVRASLHSRIHNRTLS